MLRSCIQRISRSARHLQPASRAYATAEGDQADPLDIYIDRSGLIQWKDPSTASEQPASSNKEEETALARHLKALIQVKGLRHVHVEGLCLCQGAESVCCAVSRRPHHCRRVRLGVARGQNPLSGPAAA